MNLKNEKSGYTLLEILVSFAIFGILLGIIVFGMRDTRNIEEFRTSITEFASMIKEVQNWALTGREFEGNVPPGGYGIHLDLKKALKSDLEADERQYLVFADNGYIDSSDSMCKEGTNQRYDNEAAFSPKCNNDKTVGSDTLKFGKNIALKKAVVKYLDETLTIENTDTYEYLDIAFQNFKPFPYVGICSENVCRDPDNTNYDSKKINSLELYFMEEKISMCRKITIFGASGMVQEESVECPT